MGSTPTLTRPKDPQRVAAGRAGMARRWGPPRVIRLDDLAPEQRAFIAELVAVAKRHARPAADDAA